MNCALTVLLGFLVGALCSEGASLTDGCDFHGTQYKAGDTFDDVYSCNTCTCEEGGAVACTEIYCPRCYYNEKSYTPGESFPSTDGCNTCTCDNNGGVGCTEIGCPQRCHYNGNFYNPGENFPSLDDCNTCICTNTGNVGCTKKACRKECPMFKCVPCTTGYVIDKDGCQTCQCKDPSCEGITCGQGGFCSNSYCCPDEVKLMKCMDPCENRFCGWFQYCKSYCNCFSKCEWWFW